MFQISWNLPQHVGPYGFKYNTSNKESFGLHVYFKLNKGTQHISLWVCCVEWNITLARYQVITGYNS